MKKLYAEGKLAEGIPTKQIQHDINLELAATIEKAKQQIIVLNLRFEKADNLHHVLEQFQ
jgi:hypothetical protein